MMEIWEKWIWNTMILTDCITIIMWQTSVAVELLITKIYTTHFSYYLSLTHTQHIRGCRKVLGPTKIGFKQNLMFGKWAA